MRLHTTEEENGLHPPHPVSLVPCSPPKRLAHRTASQGAQPDPVFASSQSPIICTLLPGAQNCCPPQGESECPKGQRQHRPAQAVCPWVPHCSHTLPRRPAACTATRQAGPVLMEPGQAEAAIRTTIGLSGFTALFIFPARETEQPGGDQLAEGWLHLHTKGEVWAKQLPDPCSLP